MRSTFVARIFTSIMIFILFSVADLFAQKPLITSDDTPFVRQVFYPKFSWETTPMYYMFGDGKRVLKPEEVRFIAERTDFICIEKSHGLAELGAAELGAKHEVAAFKKIKPEIKVLFYFNSAYAWPFTSYNENFTLEKIDAHPELKKFLLVDPETGELNRRGRTLTFDVLNPEFREWWVETVAKGVRESGCDGAFIDQMHGFNWLRKDKSDEVQEAMGKMMTDLKKQLGPDKILLGNNAHQDIAQFVFPAVDAIMFEHYNAELLNKENLLKDWNNMLRIAKAGKISVFRVGVEVEENSDERNNKQNKAERIQKLSKERLEYYLACFLIGAQPYSYFQYGWGWTLSSGSLVDYPLLAKPLGAPLGKYKRTNPDGWIFTREYEHASVWVNTEKGEAKITWR
ncbi:putative glycoside hydrolase [Mangrovibacterium sp.]|uniref:putative glycoside hydrolase n=1 Tax=Mangrovibacterium sp. TaxID=1961364 RepID=UPI0035659FEE